MILTAVNMKFKKFNIIMIFSTLLLAALIAPTTLGINLENNYAHDYYSYQEMTDLLHDLQSQHPDIMMVESYGKTNQNRDIWFVKISDNVEIDEDEPGILLLGAHHGDEKISFELLIYFINYMMENYEKENTDDDNDGLINEDKIDGKDNDNDGEIDEDPDEDRVRFAIDNTQIYLIPMINPDGVEANTRKNCNPDSLHGVNTNRNFGYDWIYYDLFPGRYQSLWTTLETSGNYRGSGPYSETETQAVKSVAETFTINISLSYHSGAEVVFYPWYHTTAKTPHENLFIKIGEAMGEISGYPLWRGSDPIIPVYDGTLGTSENFLYGEHNIFAYTVESSNKKAPIMSSTVLRICVKSVGVHLYLSERVQDLDNTKALLSRSIDARFPFLLTLLNRLFGNLFPDFFF